MTRIASKSFPLLAVLAISLSVGLAQAKHKPQATPTSAIIKPANPTLVGSNKNAEAAPTQTIPAEQVNTSDLLRSIAGKKHLSRKEKKEQKQQLHEDLDTTPILAEVLKLKWQAAPLQNPVKDVKKINLDKVFQDTLSHSIAVHQAEVQIKDAEVIAKETRDPIFNPLNPFDPGSFKQAAQSNAEAARAHLDTVRQQVLLSSAKAYSNLTQAYLAKYLAFQAIEQGRSQLQEEQSRFVSGETTRFDVTQTQMALLDRYGKYLETDNVFHAASMALANQINGAPENILVPDGVELQESNQSIALLQLLPNNLELEHVLKMLPNRPDRREMTARLDALQKLVKASNGLDKQKHKAELHQLELDGEKLSDASRVSAEKAFTDYTLASKTLDMARQRTDMANHYLYQLQVSHSAGFSSAKEVLDGQIELSRIRTALIAAEAAYNLSQIQLLYEMGQLHAQSISHPATGLVNAL